MKGKIITKGGFYFGQIYIDGQWVIVTDSCFTAFGAKLALKRWKKRKKKYMEFNL